MYYSLYSLLQMVANPQYEVVWCRKLTKRANFPVHQICIIKWLVPVHGQYTKFVDELNKD